MVGFEALDDRVLLTAPASPIPVTFNIPAAVASRGVYVAMFGLDNYSPSSDYNTQFYLTTDALSQGNYHLADTAATGSIPQNATSIAVASVAGFPTPTGPSGDSLLITQRDANNKITSFATVSYSSFDSATNMFQLTAPITQTFDSTNGPITVSLAQNWTASSTIGAQNTVPLLEICAPSDQYHGTVSSTVYLPQTMPVAGGELVMFVGPHEGLVANGASELAVPSVGTNPNDTFGLFEWGLGVGASPFIDYDVSAIDQVAFPFQVTAYFTNSADPTGPAIPPAAPYNQGVGFLQNRDDLFNGFTPYLSSASTNNQASVFLGLAPNGSETAQRIMAPQDYLNFVVNSGPSIAAAAAGVAGFQPIQYPAGTSGFSFSVNETPATVNVSNQGSGYSQATPPAVTFTAAPDGGTTATATAIVNASGNVTGLNFTNAGSGYTTTPAVTIAPPTSGTTAQVAVQLASLSEYYAVAALRPLVTVTAPGSGYTTTPAVTFSAPSGGGTTAQGYAVLGTGASAGQVVAVIVTNPGGGYTTAPTVTIAGGGTAQATATSALIESMAGISQPASIPPGVVSVINWNPYAHASGYNVYRSTNADMSGAVRLNGNTPYTPVALPADSRSLTPLTNSSTAVTVAGSQDTFNALPQTGTLLISQGVSQGLFQFTSATFTPGQIGEAGTIQFNGSMYAAAGLSLAKSASVALLPSYTDNGLQTGPVTVQPAVSNYNYEPLNQYYTPAVRDFFDYYRTHEFSIDLAGTVSTKWTGQTRDDVVLNPSLLTSSLAPSSTSLTISDSGVDIGSLPLSGTLDVSQLVGTTIQSGQFNYTSFVDTAGIITFTGTMSGSDSYGVGAGVALPGSPRYTALVLVGSPGHYGANYKGQVAYILQPFFNSNVDSSGLFGVENLGSPLPSYITDVTPTTSPASQVFGSNGVFDTGYGGASILGSTGAMAPTDIQKDVMNPINAALNRGLTPRSDGGGWTNVLPPDYWATNPASVTASISTTAGTLPQATYYYAVTGSQINGDTADNQTVLSNIVTVPASSLGSGGTNQVTISIPNQGVTTFTQFNIYRGTSPDDFKLIGSVAPAASGATTFPDTGASAGTTPPPFVINAPGQTANWYAAYIRQLNVSINGFAYGFPYDDQGNLSTNVNIPQTPQALQITLNPWSAAAPPTVTASTADLVQGLALTIHGSGFDPQTITNNVVAFTSSGGSAGVGSVTSVSPDGSSLTYTFTTPPALGALSVVVTTPNGDSGPVVQVATVVLAASPFSINVPPGFSINQNMTGNLVWPPSMKAFNGNPVTRLVVTLTVVDGSIDGVAAGGITVGGTGVARTFTGTIADLNRYFGTAGRITYTPLRDGTASRVLTINASDGRQFQWATTVINIVPTPPPATVPQPTIGLTTDTFVTQPRRPFPLVLTGTPFAEPGAPPAQIYTVRLQIRRGLLRARKGLGVVVRGNGHNRFFRGTLDSLNAYFTSSPGQITYQPGGGPRGPRILTISLVDRNGWRIASSSTTARIVVTPNAGPSAMHGRFLAIHGPAGRFRH